LLVLEPIGAISGNSIEVLDSAVRQELQQVLPGSIRKLAQEGRYSRYAAESNLLLEDGRICVDELTRIGRIAGVSHVLVVRILDYRPYHPQRLVMEWSLLDVDKQSPVLVLSGGVDAAEHQTGWAATQFFKARKAEPFTEAGLDVMLRSPREYARFAAAQAVDVLREVVKPGRQVF
jgi:hypothetical protein